MSRDIRAVAAGLGVEHVHAIPTSALNGDNIVEPSANTPWYDGPSLLELLETLPVDAAGDEPGFRFPVQLSCARSRPRSTRPWSTTAATRASWRRGRVVVGDEVIVEPSGRRSRVIGIDLGGRELRRGHGHPSR